jgi:predicted PolB exonuclease-like 3'-5' exonuclease
MQHQTLFVFDIETIPDTSAAYNLLGTDEKEEQKLRDELEAYHLQITDGKNSFLRQPFHKVVAVSFLEAEIDRSAGGERYILKELRSGGKENSSEKELLEGLFNYLSKSRPRFVSFNGRTFDLPVLKYRAMKYGISAPWLYHSGDKWNSYNSKWSLDWHCDLIEGLSDFGTSARVKLNEVCSIMGFPGKFGVDGGKVSEMYDDGKIKEIRDYCETDVLNTYLVYLRYMQHRGDVSIEGYNKSIGDVLSFIDNEKEKRPHLGEFFTAWEDACGGKFVL